MLDLLKFKHKIANIDSNGGCRLDYVINAADMRIPVDIAPLIDKEPKVSSMILDVDGRPGCICEHLRIRSSSKLDLSNLLDDVSRVFVDIVDNPVKEEHLVQSMLLPLIVQEFGQLISSGQLKFQMQKGWENAKYKGLLITNKTGIKSDDNIKADVVVLMDKNITLNSVTAKTLICVGDTFKLANIHCDQLVVLGGVCQIGILDAHRVSGIIRVFTYTKATDRLKRILVLSQKGLRNEHVKEVKNLSEDQVLEAMVKDLDKQVIKILKSFNVPQTDAERLVEEFKISGDEILAEIKGDPVGQDKKEENKPADNSSQTAKEEQSKENDSQDQKEEVQTFDRVVDMNVPHPQDGVKSGIIVDDSVWELLTHLPWENVKAGLAKLGVLNGNNAKFFDQEGTAKTLNMVRAIYDAGHMPELDTVLPEWIEKAQAKLIQKQRHGGAEQVNPATGGVDEPIDNPATPAV